MKPLKIAICWVVITSLAVSGCARFEPVAMPKLESAAYPYQFSQGDIHVNIAPFASVEEVKKYFAANLPKKNIWPVRMSIKNEGSKTYLFTKGLVEPNRISSHEAARKGRRKAGWRLAWGFIFWMTFFGIPIAIPLFVTGCQALGANSYMETQYKRWEISDRELKPGEEVSGILFFQHPDSPQTFKIRLMDAETNQNVDLAVDLAGMKEISKAPLKEPPDLPLASDTTAVEQAQSDSSMALPNSKSGNKPPQLVTVPSIALSAKKAA